MKYRVLLTRERDGRWSVACPALPGCHSWGENRKEALANIREAIEGYLEEVEARLRKRARQSKVVEIVV
jgi:predicted RNase H-like HicB family nuclease